MMRSRLDNGLLAALLLPALAILPLLQQAGIPNTADGIIHLLRQVDFDHAFRSGALVPRWGADLYLGFGYPLYNFAPPLLAYLLEALHLAGFPIALALQAVVVLIVELTSVGMFQFMRPKVGVPGALAAAALNVYAPFRLREALVSGGNYPQFLAMALFPLVLWAFDNLLRTGGRRAFVAAVLTSSALLLSHLFHAAVFMPLAALYVLARLRELRAPRRVWLGALGAGILALALSAFCWAPALLEASLTAAGAEHFVRTSDFHQRFLSWQRLLAAPRLLDFAEANADVPLALGWVQLACGALGLLAVLRRRAERSSAFVLMGLFVCFSFLQLPASAFVWDSVPLLGLAEYPWRFMGVSVFTLAALGGYVVPASPPSTRGIAVALLVAGAALLSAFPYLVAPRGFVPLFAPDAEAVLQFERSTGALGLTTLSEYLPNTVQELPADRPAPLSRPRHDAPADTVESAQWSPLGEALVLNLPQPRDVRFRTFYFPGWTATLDGTPARLDVAHDGTFSVAVPAGRHRLETRFADTPLRTAASLISLAALVVLGIVIWRVRATPTGPVDSAGRGAPVAVAALVAVLGLAWLALNAGGALRAARAIQPVALFGEQLELLGAEVDEPVIAPGAELHVRVFWRPARALQTDYKVIAQLIAADGRAVAGSDKQHPGDPVTQGETPTSQIAAGKYLRDEHAIRIPPDLVPGRYDLRVGAYDPQTGRRLRLPNGETLFSVATIEVR